MIARILLVLQYIYDEGRQLYKRIGTHHTITIAEYEELEKEYASTARYQAYVAMACMAIGAVVITLVAMEII